MKLRKGAFVSVIAADIALALISVQGNKVNADTVTSNVKKENAVTVYSSNITTKLLMLKVVLQQIL